MTVSILMSVYNGASTLSAAIDSVLTQTYRDFEFIICDDASSDESWEILCTYQKRDPRIQLLRNDQNCGLAASLNHCLKAAKGQYIARQDADDVSDPERLERTLQYQIDHDLPYV